MSDGDTWAWSLGCRLGLHGRGRWAVLWGYMGVVAGLSFGATWAWSLGCPLGLHGRVCMCMRVSVCVAPWHPCGSLGMCLPCTVVYLNHS